MKITIKVFENENLVFTKVFDKGIFRAGRSEFCDIILSDEKMSRSAVEFRVTESSVYVTNMGVAGKLKINGKKQETGELKEGAYVEVGKFKLALLMGEQENQLGSSKATPVAEGNEPPADNLVIGQSENSPNDEGFLEQGIPGMNQGFGQPEEERAPAQPEPEANPIRPEENVIPFQSSPRNDFAGANSASEGNLALKEKTETVGKPLVAKILIVEGPRSGEEIPLQAYELSFGRSAKADVVINDEKLSRIHAKIIRFGTGYRIIDLNSHNGTRVNGVRILEHPLSSYDIIEFGNTKIKFLIHDLILNDQGSSASLVPAAVSAKDPTKSLYLDEAERQEISRLRKDFEGQPPEGDNFDPASLPAPEPKKRSPLKILLVVVLAVILGLWAVSLSNQKETNKKTENQVAVTTEEAEKTAVLPKIPKGFYELSEEMQRRIEGYYNSAVSSMQRTDLSLEEIEKARDDLRRIHQSISYYKNSRELLDQVDKRYRDKMSQMAAEKAKKDELQDLNIYLEDGLEYLKQGDFDRAAESFQLALNLEPRNIIAIKGLKAAELKVRSIENLPSDRDPEEDKKTTIKELYEKAIQALNNRAYQEAIDFAEKIRKINLKSDQTYLNEAKQIIDRAKIAQKEEFEPFLVQAKEKFSEGDYNASRDLCEEMLKRDPAYDEAKELLAKSKKQLNRLAKEAYTHGYILESIGQIEQAKQYWNRAKNYVRQGDDYFDKVNKKLDQYQ
jgi:pSer/pThr/pTyr-binding forkhead associated (FHA) protein/tetratricopeptide (TPR) repeat protein